MANFQELVKNSYFTYALWALLLIMLVIFTTSTYRYIQKNTRIYKERFKQVAKKFEVDDLRRKKAQQIERAIYGAVDKSDIMQGLGRKIELCGLRLILPWMTPEMLIICEGVSASVAAFVVILISGSWLLGIGVAIIYLAIVNLAVEIYCGRTVARVEDTLLQFMNIVENFASTSDDLISILGKTAVYVPNPLSKALQECAIEARNSGNASQALVALQEKIPSAHFQVLIRNLEISSRYECNYAEVIRDCRDVFHSYLRSQKEKKAIRTNGAVESLAMLFCGGICISMAGNIADSGNIFVTLIASGLIGQAIVAYLGVVVVAVLYNGVYKSLKG